MHNLKILLLSSFLSILSIVFLNLNARDPMQMISRFIGYYPIDKIVKKDTTDLSYDKLTHLDLAFFNPDSLR